MFYQLLKSTLVVFAGVYSIFGYTQTPHPESGIPLSSAIEMGLANNKELLHQKGLSTIAKYQVKAEAMEQYPEIAFESEFAILDNIHQYEHGLLNPSTTYETPRTNYDFSVKAEIPVYTGGQIKYAKKIAGVESQVQDVKFYRDERKLRLKIITAYLNVLHLQEQGQLIENKIREDHIIIKQISAMQENGLVTNNEVLRSQLQLSNHQLTLSEFDREIVIISEMLKPLLGLNEQGTLKLSTAGILEEDLSSTNENKDTQQAIASNEDFQLLNLHKQVLEFEKKKVRANVLPSVTAGASYGYSYPNFMFFPPQEFLYRFGTVGVKLAVPLSSLYKNRVKMSIAQQQLTNNGFEIEGKLEKIMSDISVARERYQQVGEKIPIAQKAITLAKENYRIVKMKYANKLSLITELIDADNACLEAESKLISLTIDEKLKYYQLQFLLGNI